MGNRERKRRFKVKWDERHSCRLFKWAIELKHDTYIVTNERSFYKWNISYGFLIFTLAITAGSTVFHDESVKNSSRNFKRVTTIICQSCITMKSRYYWNLNDKIIYRWQTVMRDERFNSKINVASSVDASIEIFAKTWRLARLPSAWTSYGC